MCGIEKVPKIMVHLLPICTIIYRWYIMYSGDPKEFLVNEFGKCFKLKEKYIAPPTQYFGNNMTEVELSNGTKCWSFSSS